MGTRLSTRTVILAAALAAVACGEDKNPTFPSDGEVLMRLEASQESIGVGLETPLSVTASVTRDATGDTCTFDATAGTFELGRSERSRKIVVNVNGEASIHWFAPQEPGRVRITASIRTVTASTEVEVTPVPQVIIAELPDSLAAGETVRFRVAVPATWSRKAVEVRASHGSLLATGPVLEGLDRGGRILPLTDQNGEARLLFTAPAAANDAVTITASLFGTISSVLVRVQER